ncbi:hypothetical protein OHA25_19165 [Nonomuraea sp. NBC_00507]|uniref:hypothetical protein n=1 Tax=Nonomuraea sp. NBC_00507 TaxID=2976002 RepID=UPI002E196602
MRLAIEVPEMMVGRAGGDEVDVGAEVGEVGNRVIDIAPTGGPAAVTGKAVEVRERADGDDFSAADPGLLSISAGSRRSSRTAATYLNFSNAYATSWI